MTSNALPRRFATAAALLLALVAADKSRAEDSDVALASNAAAVAAAPTKDEEKPAGPFKLYWKDGKTVFESDNFLLTLSNRVQFRFTQIQPDDEVLIAGTEKAGDGIGSFRVRRAKTKLEGWFWKKELSFELQVGWAGSDSSGGSSTFSGLEDARLTWDASKDKRFQVTIGQFKVPFGRQELTSSENMQFADRSILSGEFTHGRDVGVQLHGLLADGKVDYRGGVFNGNGRNKPINDNAKYQYNAMLTFQPWGEVKASEGDMESKDKALLAVGGEVESNNLHGATNATDLNDTTFGGFAVFKCKGFSAFGEYFNRKRDPEQGESFHSNGYQLQAGYFLRKERWEVAFRYASWDPTDAKSGDDQKEIGGALNYFIKKHDLKIQGDFRQLEDKIAGTKNKELRVQTQFVF